jgi:glycosyltransferase involved in cell wall biosynthesis
VLAARVGGIPELVPERFHGVALCESDAGGIAAGIRRALALAPDERGALARDLFRAVAAEQVPINERVSMARAELVSESAGGWGAGAGAGRRSPGTRPSTPEGRKATVVVPCFRTPLQFIRDLAVGLSEQSVRPERVIVVDDGSDGEYAEQLEAVLARYLAVPFDVIKHPINLGDAAARNTGLSRVSTDCVIFVDSDNVPGPDFVERHLEYLGRDPGMAAVTSYHAQFRDGTDWQDEANVSRVWKPIGNSVVIAQLRGRLGDSTAAFDTASLREVGGWDASDRAGKNDRALFIRMLGLKKRIGVIPRPIYLYRVRSDSMGRTYDRFAGEWKVARNCVGLGRFDAFRLFGLLRELRELRREQEKWPGGRPEPGGAPGRLADQESDC